MTESFRPWKLGFIGGSMHSAVGYTHKIACEMDGQWSLQAGCFSRNEQINKTTAQQWRVPVERVYPDYQTLLANEKDRLDALVILTPTPMHAEIVTSALDAGYAVVCEKAMAVSVQEAEQIKAAVNRNNGFLAVTFNYSGYPMIRELKKQIAKGTLGHIQQIHIEMPQEGFIRLDTQSTKPHPQAWRLQDQTIPTISLDLGVHLHHLVYFLTGESPLEVVADYSSFGWFSNVVDNVMCLVKYTNGVRCSMWYSKTALGNRNGLKVRVYGDQGSAEWFQMQPEELLISFPDGEKRIIDRGGNDVGESCLRRYNRFKAGHPAGFIEAFANLYSDIADSLNHYKKNQVFNGDTVVGVDHATEGLRLFEAISRSAAEHSWFKV